MPLISVIATLLVIGVILWLSNSCLPIDGTIKKITNAAVAKHSNEPLDPPGGSSRGGDEGQSVSLAHRALPLIQLLTAAAAWRENVMWDK